MPDHNGRQSGPTHRLRTLRGQSRFGVTAHIRVHLGIGFQGMGVASKSDGVRRGAAADLHVVELGKLMLARAPRLGMQMADLLCREIDAYRDGSVVTKEQVAESCVANLTFIFDSLAGNADVDVSPAEHTGTTRALAGVPLPAVMTAYRIGFRFMWEETLATARVAAIPTDSILDATARVFLAQDTFTQAMSSAYRQQLTAQILEREEERSALVEALLSRRITDRHILWEAADLLRLPTSGPYAVVAAELPAIGKLGLPTIENKLSVRDIRSAWRLLPDLQVGIVHLGAPRRRTPSARLSRCSAKPRPHESASVRRFTSWPKQATRCDSPGWPSPGSRRPSRSLLSSTTPRLPSRRSARPRLWRRSGRWCCGGWMNCLPRNARFCSIPSGPGSRRAALQTAPRRRSFATPIPCGTVCTASRS